MTSCMAEEPSPTLFLFLVLSQLQKNADRMPEKNMKSISWRPDTLCSTSQKKQPLDLAGSSSTRRRKQAPSSTVNKSNRAPYTPQKFIYKSCAWAPGASTSGSAGGAMATPLVTGSGSSRARSFFRSGRNRSILFHVSFHSSSRAGFLLGETR